MQQRHKWKKHLWRYIFIQMAVLFKIDVHDKWILLEYLVDKFADFPLITEFVSVILAPAFFLNIKTFIVN